jgi:hypothetical protein
MHLSLRSRGRSIQQSGKHITHYVYVDKNRKKLFLFIFIFDDSTCLMVFGCDGSVLHRALAADKDDTASYTVL